MAAAVLDADRFFDPDPAVRRVARELYQETRRLPIVSPHGHVDPAILARDEPFAEPAALIVQPDHYILRLLYARGVPLEALGVPRRDRRGGGGGGGAGGAGGARRDRSVQGMAAVRRPLLPVPRHAHGRVARLRAARGVRRP